MTGPRREAKPRKAASGAGRKTAARGDERLRAMDPEARRAFCREVLERLSDLVEGEAPEDFRAEVDAILGDCRPFLAFRNTLEATIRATRRLSEADPASAVDEETLARCVERARKALAISQGPG